MTNPKKLALIGVGLAGLYLLSSQGGSDSGGSDSGGFSGSGGGDEAGDTIINFPDLDLSNIWGDAPTVTKKFMTQEELDADVKIMPWYDYLPAGDKTIGDWFRAQPASSKITSNVLNPQAVPYSIHDPVKKASYVHHKVSLPDPVKLGLTPRRTSSGGFVGSHVWTRGKKIATPTPTTYAWSRAGKLPGY